MFVNQKFALVILLLTAFTSLTLTHAQETTGGDICLGWSSIDPQNERVVSGSITNEDPVHTWTFEGDSDSTIYLRIEVIDGDLDPFL